MAEETPHVRAIRSGMIKFMRKYMMDMDFMKQIVIQNPEAFDAKDDILKQFDMLKSSFKGVIDYNFYPVEIEAVENLDKE